MTILIVGLCYCLYNLFVSGFDAQFYYVQGSYFGGGIHYRTLATYGMLAILSLYFFNKVDSPLNAYFYSMCLVLLNIGLFELPLQIVYFKNSLIEGRIGLWAKNTLLFMLYVSFIIPLATFYNRFKDHLEGIVQRKHLLVIAIIYGIVWVWYIQIRIYNVVSGQWAGPFQSVTVHALVCYFQNWLAKLVTAVPSIYYLVKCVKALDSGV